MPHDQESVVFENIIFIFVTFILPFCYKSLCSFLSIKMSLSYVPFLNVILKGIFETSNHDKIITNVRRACH